MRYTCTYTVPDKNNLHLYCTCTYTCTVPDKKNLHVHVRVTRNTCNLYCLSQARPICKILCDRGRYAVGSHANTFLLYFIILMKIKVHMIIIELCYNNIHVSAFLD